MRSLQCGLAFLCLAASGVLGAAVEVKPDPRAVAKRAGLGFLEVGHRVGLHVNGMKTPEGAVEVTLIDSLQDEDEPKKPVEEEEEEEEEKEEKKEKKEKKKKKQKEEEEEEEEEEEAPVEEPEEEEEEEEAPAKPEPEEPEEEEEEEEEEESEPEEPEVEEPEPEEPETEEPAEEEEEKIDVNALIDHVTYSGTGCPEGSLSFDHDWMQDVPIYFFTEFFAYMGAELYEDEPFRECQLDMAITDIPAGYRFVIADTRAEGAIYLEKGMTANFTTDVWWNDDTEGKAHNHKYWPNIDRDSPISVANYMTSPFSLDETAQKKHASVCTTDGPTSGTLRVKIRIGVEALAPDYELAPAEVTVRALGVTSKLIACA